MLEKRGGERRRYRRYHVKNVSYAVFKTPAGRQMAQVMDISKGGLAVHSSSRLARSKTFALLNLIVYRNGFRIDKLPFRAVFTIELPSTIPFGPTGKKRYGLKFGKLDAEQANLLESFISRHTIDTFGFTAAAV